MSDAPVENVNVFQKLLRAAIEFLKAKDKRNAIRVARDEFIRKRRIVGLVKHFGILASLQ